MQSSLGFGLLDAVDVETGSTSGVAVDTRGVAAPYGALQDACERNGIPPAIVCPSLFDLKAPIS